MILVMQLANIIKRLRTMAEARKYEYKLHVPEITDIKNINLLREGDTLGYVKFYHSHDPFR